MMSNIILGDEHPLSGRNEKELPHNVSISVYGKYSQNGECVRWIWRQWRKMDNRKEYVPTTYCNTFHKWFPVGQHLYVSYSHPTSCINWLKVPSKTILLTGLKDSSTDKTAMAIHKLYWTTLIIGELAFVSTLLHHLIVLCRIATVASLQVCTTFLKVVILSNGLEITLKL